MENVEINVTKKQYSQSQTTLLMKSMLIAGIAFIILGFASYGFSQLFINTIANAWQSWNMGWIICLTMLLGGMIISMLWAYNMFKAGSWPLTIICYVLYIAMISVAFGWIFAVGFENNLTWLPVIFGIAGAVFLLTALIAKFMSVNGVITMSKIIGATAIAMSIIMVVFLIMMIVSATVINPGVWAATDALCCIIMVCMAIVSFLYIVIDIWQIQKISEFSAQAGVQENKILPWLFGYRLLTDLVNIVFVVIFFVLRFGKRA